MVRCKRLPPLLFLLTVCLFILMFGSATIVATSQTLEDFSYDGIFWEDWSGAGNGAYDWNSRNNTLNLISNTLIGESEDYLIYKPFKIDEGEDRIAFSYYYRLSRQNTSSSWTYYKIHTLTANGGAQSDYQIKLIVKYGAGSDSGNTMYANSHCRTDFGDLRFYSSGSECDYWFEEKHDSDNVTVWVEVPTIPATPNTVDILVFYGNAVATSNSDGDNTFLDFIDMEDGTINEWDATYGTATKTASTDYPHTGTYDLKMVPAVGSPSGSGVEETISSWDDEHAYRIWFYDALTKVSQYDEQTYISDGVSNVHMGYLDANDNYHYWDGAGWTDSGIVRTLGFHYYEWQVLPTLTHLVIDGVNFHDSTRLIETALTIVRYTCYRGNAYPSWFDDFLVRKYISAEPTHTSWGSEQSSQTLNQFTTNLIYSVQTQNQSISIIHNDTAIQLKYYDGAGLAQSYSKNFSTMKSDGADYFKADIIITSEYREIDLDLENATRANVIDETFNIEAVPSRFLGIQFNNSVQNFGHGQFNSTLEIVWVVAPFPEVEGLRGWHKNGLGTPDTENEYNIIDTSVGGDNEYADVLCMPFQGFKALWNWSGITNNFDSVQVKIEWFDRGGTLTGWVVFQMHQTSGVRYFKIYDSDVGTGTISVTGLGSDGAMAICVWVDTSNKVWAYAQEDPESHTFGDFWLLDITPSTDLDSWGVRITHTASKALGADVRSTLKEVEIFYGKKEGISQPRFGGMWWEYNPLLMFFVWLGSLFMAGFVWLATAVGTVLAPFFYWLGEYLAPVIGQVVNDFIGSFLAPLWNWFVNNVLAPFWNFLLTWFINSFFLGIVFLQSLFNTLLAGISLWFWGDATILPNLVASIFLFIYEVIRGLGTFLVSGNILGIGFYIMSFLGGNASAFGWVSIGAGTIPDMLLLGLYWGVTLLPPFFVIYITLTLMACLTSFVHDDFDFNSFKPLWDMVMFFFMIGKFLFDFLKGMIMLVWNTITAIMELIPF